MGVVLVQPAPQRVTTMGIVEALDRAFTGEACDVVRSDGMSSAMLVGRWQRDATPADVELFVDTCDGPTLDVGCGPGRLTVALTARGLDAVGIDISHEAVRQTRQRGSAALRVDVFDHSLAARTWQHVLLADGNIGIGGDAVRLLRCVAALLAPHGSALVELASTPGGSVHEQVRLRIGAELSEPFSWATVGVEAIDDLARAAGLKVSRIHRSAGRTVATLRHRHPRLRPGMRRRWR